MHNPVESALLLRICIQLLMYSLGIRSSPPLSLPLPPRRAHPMRRLVSHIDIDALTGDRADVASHRIAWRVPISFCHNFWHFMCQQIRNNMPDFGIFRIVFVVVVVLFFLSFFVVLLSCCFCIFSGFPFVFIFGQATLLSV